MQSYTTGEHETYRQNIKIEIEQLKLDLTKTILTELKTQVGKYEGSYGDEDTLNAIAIFSSALVKVNCFDD